MTLGRSIRRQIKKLGISKRLRPGGVVESVQVRGSSEQEQPSSEDALDVTRRRRTAERRRERESGDPVSTTSYSGGDPSDWDDLSGEAGWGAGEGGKDTEAERSDSPSSSSSTVFKQGIELRFGRRYQKNHGNL